MRAQLVTCFDPFRPAHRRTVVEIRRRRRLSALAPKTRQPFICLVNGTPVLRAGWRRRVKDGDTVAFVLLPQGGGGGGGGSNPLAVVAGLALMVFVPGIAGAIHGALWNAGIQLGTTGLMILKAGVGIVGGMLINAVLPPPKPPAPMQMSAGGGLASPSPTYSLNAQGNSARLGMPIPVLYGRHVIYPDFAAAPYVEYGGNEQYLYQLFVLTQGECDIEAIRIEDTPISSFAEITTEIVPPGGTVTLFPTNVVTSVEVSGQEAATGVALGPYTANAAGTQANALAIDVVMPRGLYYANDTGGLSNVSCAWTVEAQLIDDYGAPAGAWFTLGNETINAATTTPQRMSYRYDVTPGRYQVRLTRTDTKQTDSRYGHELDWAGLRSYLPGSQSYGDVTLLAMRLRATSNLSGQASRKINVIATRRLPTWSAAGGWSAPVATRSPAWAFADACRAAYGAGLADARIDLAALAALAATWAARGDCFDGIFDSQTVVWDALTQIARAGRAQPFMQAGLVHCVRDAAATLPVALFSQRNIRRGSFKIQYLMASEETADAVEVSYFDEVVWTERTVTCTLPGGTSDQPAKVKLFGVTARQQAWQEGMYIAACNRYRRRLLTFGTEMEGFIPALGDLVAVQHDMPKWGQAGEIVAWDAATKTAITSEPLDWSAGGAHVLAMRRRDGSVAGPYAATIGTDAYHVVLADWTAATDPTPDTGGDRERSHYAFGPANAQYIRARVLSVRPQSTETVEISAVVESDYVHTADTGAAPGSGAWQLPSDFSVPVVAGPVARSMPDAPDKMLLSWQPAAGADYYLVEQSNGDGRWTRTGEPSSANYTATALYGASTLLRVAAVGMTTGPWVEIGYAMGASYMWTTDSALMWNADDTTLMWRY